MNVGYIHNPLPPAQNNTLALVKKPRTQNSDFPAGGSVLAHEKKERKLGVSQVWVQIPTPPLISLNLGFCIYKMERSTIYHLCSFKVSMK